MSRPLSRVPWLTNWKEPYMVFIQNHGPELVSIDEPSTNAILVSNQAKDCEIYLRKADWKDGHIIETTVSKRITIADFQPDIENGLYVYHSDMEKLKSECMYLHSYDIAATILWDYKEDHIVPKRFLITSKYTWAGFNYGNVLMDTHVLLS